MSNTPDRPASIDPSADPGRDLPADPVLGSAAAALLHRARWGASADTGRLSRRAAIETLFLAVLRERFPPEAGPVRFGDILDVAAQLATIDPEELYWIGRLVWSRGTLPRGWPGDLPGAEGLRWRTTDHFGLPEQWLGLLIRPGARQPLPLDMDFAAPEPISYEMAHFPLRADLPLLAADAPLPAHEAGFAVMLAWAHRLFDTCTRPHIFEYWARHWFTQYGIHAALDGLADVALQRWRKPVPGPQLFAAAMVADPATDVRGGFVDPKRFLRAGREQFFGHVADVMLAQRRALFLWYHFAPDAWTARPWGPAGNRREYESGPRSHRLVSDAIGPSLLGL